METRRLNGETLICLKNRALEISIAPGVGGRITSVRSAGDGYEFLWTNGALPLERLEPGSEYDPNFYGGIDELLPNDMPEYVNGIHEPDHGELWTRALDWRMDGEALTMETVLPRCGLEYRKTVSLAEDAPEIVLHYRVSNPTCEARDFLWKMHAALRIAPGDEIICPAAKAVSADPEWSRVSADAPFEWPNAFGMRADRVPERDGSTEFLYLYNLQSGEIGWQRSAENRSFVYRFDPNVFPYCWYFASYGGFFGHYTAVLEPCSAMPISVSEAAAKGACSRLAPGECIETTVTIHVGEIENDE